MSLDADLIADRRRIRRKLTFWRVTAITLIILAIAGCRHTHQQSRRPDRRPSLYRARDHFRSHPRRSRARRAAGSAGAVVDRARRHRPCRQPRRHHRRLRAAVQFAVPAARAEAAGGRRRQHGGLGRLHHRARRRSHRGAADLAGRLDRRAVSVSELHRSPEQDRRQDGGGEIDAAEGRAGRL